MTALLIAIIIATHILAFASAFYIYVKLRRTG